MMTDIPSFSVRRRRLARASSTPGRAGSCPLPRATRLVRRRDFNHRLKQTRSVVFRLVALLGMLLFTARGVAAESIPALPRDHFNDYARMVSSETSSRLNAILTQFERDTSNQILVAIYAKMDSASSIEDYTVRVVQAWQVGQKERKNGAVLFVFKDDRALFLQVGYGLEGVLPDARSKQIIENEIMPRFRAGDFDGGITAGVTTILASIRGEYTGTGQTVKDAQSGGGRGVNGWIMLVIFIVIVLRSLAGNRRGTLYSPGGRRGVWMPPMGGGGSWGGGGSRGGGGGTFSGGGGSFGGGGAGGRW